MMCFYLIYKRNKYLLHNTYAFNMSGLDTKVSSEYDRFVLALGIDCEDEGELILVTQLCILKLFDFLISTRFFECFVPLVNTKDFWHTRQLAFLISGSRASQSLNFGSSNQRCWKVHPDMITSKLGTNADNNSCLQILILVQYPLGLGWFAAQCKLCEKEIMKLCQNAKKVNAACKLPCNPKACICVCKIIDVLCVLAKFYAVLL